MGKQYKHLTEKDIAFANRQRLFFVASTSGKEVNLAPKGDDCFRFLDEKTMLILDYPGSSNRTELGEPWSNAYLGFAAPEDLPSSGQQDFLD